MKTVTLDARIAKAVADALRARWVGAARADAIFHSLSDIVMAAIRHHTAADEALRRKIMLELESALPQSDALVDIEVSGGAVQLRGIVPSESRRRQICSLASCVAGVTSLHDHLVYVDLDTGAFLLSPEDSSAEMGQPGADGHGSPQSS